ncbi:hypothetical protein G6O67_007524 [Ophiocordyceps sinensis]|nr:hypothetical protein G6O67_007524 [Ophiocordyceps sinensis]
MFVSAAVCLVILRGWKIGQVREMARLTDEAPEHIDSAKAESNDDFNARSRKSGRKTMLTDCLKANKV